MTLLSDDTTRDVEAARERLQLRLVLSGALPTDRTRIRCGPGNLVLGRGQECDVKLDFAEVSRRHAEIGHDGSALVLRDLDSTNGAFVDGRRVRFATLREGSVVRLGTWLGVVETLGQEELDSWCVEVAPGLFGGARIQRALAPLRAVGNSTLPVVLVGDTGTGKERFASALHYFSQRSGPFHAVNCAALPEALAESELFGHERGAFTGAELRTRGHFRAAEGGTLFLDEVQELSAPLQSKLLRAVELKQVTPLGDSRSFRYDARIVVASQRPFSELVAAGRLRADLAMRFSGLTVTIPSLAQRRPDIPALFGYFLRENASGPAPVVSSKFYERLCLHDWPGNIRELELLARRMLALHGQSPLSVSELPEALSASNGDEVQGLSFETRDEEDRHRLDGALKQTGGNVKKAAGLVNLSRARAYRLLGKQQPADEGSTE